MSPLGKWTQGTDSSSYNATADQASIFVVPQVVSRPVETQRYTALASPPRTDNFNRSASLINTYGGRQPHHVDAHLHV